MTENKYTSTRIVDGKPRKVIVDENGKITNRNPGKEELNGLEKEPIKHRDTRKKYTEEELLDYLRIFEKNEGRTPKEEDFINNPKYPGFRAYINRFETWNKALDKAFGTKRYKYGREQYTEEQLLEYLILFEKKEGRSPKIEDFTNNTEYPGFTTYVRYFGSWIDALTM